MTIRMSSLEVHHGLHAASQTRLPIRSILAQWVRELGVKNTLGVFPGPRNNPGNITSAHVGRVCGYLEGGSATEHHKFPVFCSAAEGVKEYIWYFNNLSYYDHIAAAAAGNWIKACNLIEASPWSSDHYGRTLDQTGYQITAILIHPIAPVVNVRAKATRSSAAVGRVSPHTPLAFSGTVTGESIGGKAHWYRVRYGGGNGKMVYIHESVAEARQLDK